MACNEFEVSGLLYVSGELNAGEAAAYEAHLGKCEECRRETDAYRHERASLYTAEILGDNPSEAVDSEILRVCANPKKMIASSAMTPMMFIRKYAPVPIFLMLVAVAIGMYVQYHSMSAVNLRAKLTDEATAVEALARTSSQTPAEQNATEVNADDKLVLADSSNDSGRIPPKSMGNLEMEGVVTVSGSE